MASIQLTPEKGLQLEKAEQHIVESTRVLNDISQSVRHEEINIYDQIAKYSGGTASVMFTFLGVLKNTLIICLLAQWHFLLSVLAYHYSYDVLYTFGFSIRQTNTDCMI